MLRPAMSGVEPRVACAIICPNPGVFFDIMGGDRPLPQRAAIVASNPLVPAGVVLLGLSAVEAIFLIWLDTLIVSLQLGALVGAALGRSMPAPPPGTHRGGWVAGVCLGALFAAPAVFVPAIGLGIGLYEMIKPQFPEGPLAAVFSDPAIYPCIAAQIGLRGYQIIVHATRVYRNPEAMTSFRIGVPDQVLGLVFRTVVLMALAWLSSWFGRPGLLLFLLAASAFLIYTDLREGWVRQLGRRFMLR